MSLTETERIFAGVTEGAINDLLLAFFSARPRHLNYGSPGFLPSTSVSGTTMPAIAFPGVPGGIDWSVKLSVPVVDLHPETTGLPPELALLAGQLSVVTSVRLCISCSRRGKPDDVDHDDRPNDHHGHDEKRDERKQRERERDEQREREERERDESPIDATCASLRVFAVGHVERRTGPDAVWIAIDSVEIVDIEPNSLEAVFECLLLQILRAVMAGVNLPIQTLRAGAFSLSISRGPEIEDDALKTYGNL